MNKGFCLALPGLSIREGFEAYGMVRPTFQSTFLDSTNDWHQWVEEGRPYVVDVIVGDPAYNYNHSIHRGFCAAVKELRKLADQYQEPAFEKEGY